MIQNHVHGMVLVAMLDKFISTCLGEKDNERPNLGEFAKEAVTFSGISRNS